MDPATLALGATTAGCAMVGLAIPYLVRIEHRLTKLETKITFLVPDEEPTKK